MCDTINWEDHKGLVINLAHKFAKRHGALSFDDLLQEGYIKLLEAVDKFRPEDGNKFSTFAVPVIYRGMSRAIDYEVAARDLKPKNPTLSKPTNHRVISMWSTKAADGSVFARPIDAGSPDPEDAAFENELYELAMEYLGDLTPDKQFAIEQRYGLGNGVNREWQDIADEAGANRKTVAQRAYNGLGELQEMFADWDLGFETTPAG